VAPRRATSEATPRCDLEQLSLSLFFPADVTTDALLAEAAAVSAVG
jgi:hypothetical protein